MNLRHALSLASLALCASQVNAQTYTNTARPADSFVDSIGVNIHLNYLNTPYGQFSNVLLPAFSWSGIRHARDGAVTNWTGLNASTYFYADMRQLAAVGVHFNLVTSWLTDPTVLPSLSGWMAGSLESFEGANEPDTTGDPNWLVDTRNWQSTLWTTVGSNSSLAGVKVLAPTPGLWAAGQLGSLAAVSNFGNMHPYAGGYQPLTNLAYNEQITNILTGSNPIIASEAGYHNALKAAAGNGVQPPVDQLTAAKYDLRLLLGMFSAGVARTYIYELMDEDLADPTVTPESSFGLIEGNGTYKPAFKAIGNLIHLCQDPGPAFTPAPFSYTLTGGDANTQSTLLAKRDGSFLLAVWEEVPSWDPVKRVDIKVPLTRVSISFTGPEYYGEFYNQLSKSGAAQGTFGNTNHLTVMVNDVVTVLHLMPKKTQQSN